MSSAVFSTSTALGRPLAFDSEAVDSEAVLKLRPVSDRSSWGKVARLPAGFIAADPRLASVTPASRLDVRPAPEMVSTGIPAIDALTGGLPRGCLTEICGPASSGRTTLLLSALTAATRRGECCVVVDANDALDPQSVVAAGVQLEKLLWVRCGGKSSDSPQRYPTAALRAGSDAEKKSFHKNRASESGRTESRQAEQLLEQVLRATDLLLDSGGFGLIVLDLGDLPAKAARYIPLTTWFRFRRTVEHTPTVLLAIEQQPIAGSCSSLLLKLGGAGESLSVLDEPAAERCKSAAHGPSTALRVNSSRGSVHIASEEAPDGRKKICLTEQTVLDFLNPAHAQLLTGLEITAELLRSRLERKPARAASVAFASKTAWAG